MESVKKAIQNKRISHKGTNFVIRYIDYKLTSINQSNMNGKTALKISFELLIFGSLYTAYCYYYFHGIWYLNVLILISALIFMFNYLDIRFELLNKKFRNDIPKTIRKLRYYLIHTKNIGKALGKTYDKSPDTTKKYIEKLKYIVDSEDIKGNMNKFKESIPLEWLKMLCDLVYYCAVNGDKDQNTSKNLSRITNIIEFTNIEQGLDNAEILWAQIFVFFVPLIGIPCIKTFNSSMMAVLEQPNIYAMQEAGIMAAKILLISNISTLFLSWIRKNS